MLQLGRPSPAPCFGVPPPSSAATASPHPTQRRIQRMLARYVASIRDDDCLPQLNAALRSQGSADMRSYYAARPELRGYTLGVEMERDLEYSLVLRDGATVTDKRSIRAHFGGGKGGAGSGRSRGGVASTEELLVRAANQSLLADALAALVGSEDALAPERPRDETTPRLVFSGPLLSMALVGEKCHFTIDLKRGRVEALCVLAVGVPAENRRLVLAQAILIVAFCPRTERQVQYVLQTVRAHHDPLSPVLRDAAMALARDHENLCSFRRIDACNKVNDKENGSGTLWTFDRERFDADMKNLRGFARKVSNGFKSSDDEEHDDDDDDEYFGDSMSWSDDGDTDALL